MRTMGSKSAERRRGRASRTVWLGALLALVMSSLAGCHWGYYYDRSAYGHYRHHHHHHYGYWHYHGR